MSCVCGDTALPLTVTSSSAVIGALNLTGAVNTASPALPSAPATCERPPAIVTLPLHLMFGALIVTSSPFIVIVCVLTVAVCVFTTTVDALLIVRVPLL